MSEHRFETPRPVRLEVKVASGEIDVTSVAGGESIIELEGSQNMLADVHVELTGDRLVVEQRRKGFMGLLNNFGEALRVRAQIPDVSRVNVATAASEVRLDGTFGGLQITSASGDLRLTGEIDGNADVKTVSGDVRLERVAGELKVKTVSGDVVAEAVGGSVSVKSVSADLYVGALREGRVDVQSVSGNITLGISAGTSIDVDAGSAAGDLSSDIPLSADASESDPGPTVVVRVNTVSGDLRLRRAA